LLQNVPSQATRYGYAEAIVDLAKVNPDIVVLNADVAKSIKTTDFAEAYPEREFNFGIAEQNMVAAAAGMATTGLIPFATSYAVFLTMRALDQVRNSVHYPKLNVKIASSHGGITPGPDGPTHQGQEDLNIMRAIGNSTVIAPADSTSTKMATWAAADFQGPVYLSFTRDPVPYLYTTDFPFEIGKAVTIREGEDATIVAIRDMVTQALIAAEILAQKELKSA
jgi:transketolase